MREPDDFSLQILLKNLHELDPAQLESYSVPELESILANFPLSWGQSLALDHTSRKLGIPARIPWRFTASYLPFYIAPDFPTVSQRQARALAVAVSCFSLYVMLLDRSIDEPFATPITIKLATQHVLHRFYHALAQLFEANSTFWGEVECLLGEMSQAMLREYQVHNSGIQPFSVEEFRKIAHGKMSCSQINCVALARLNGTPELIPTLTSCWDAIGLAAVVRDDILDWQEDYRNHNYTYLLSHVLLSAPFYSSVMAGDLPPITEVGAALFCTDTIEALYDMAVTELEIASQQADTINCPALKGLIVYYQQEMKSRKSSLIERKIVALSSFFERKIGNLSS